MYGYKYSHLWSQSKFLNINYIWVFSVYVVTVNINEKPVV